MRHDNEQPPDVLKEWIDSVNTEGRNLTNWELGFMASITEQFELTNRLTERQAEVLERIYAHKTP